jgi:rare lipoprotein A (peptidoglycan hydrolase)
MAKISGTNWRLWLRDKKASAGMISRLHSSRLLLWSFALLLSGCALRSPAYVPPPPPPAQPVVYKPPPAPKPPAIVTRASWYGPGFEGHRTATGERFNSEQMTAAAKDVPLGSHVLVTNLKNGRSATVRINDCGPYRPGRKIDLSKRAARKLGIIHDGTAKVKVVVIKKPADAPVCKSPI